MCTNVQFEYLYRDGANYKAWETIVFSNPDCLPVADIDNQLRRMFEMGILFIAGQVQVPEIFLYNEGKLTSDDHCFHEYDHVELTDFPPDDLKGRTIRDFLIQVRLASQQGWEVFDPFEWVSSKKATDRSRY